MTTENIMLQETEMMKTGFCEMCGGLPAELVCKECGQNICQFCNVGFSVCYDCDYKDRDEDDDDE